MKKVISIILVFVLLLSALSVPVFATSDEGEIYLFKDEFIDQHVGEYEYDDGLYYYREVYYHHMDESDPQSAIDWVLVNAQGGMCLTWLVKGEIGDVIFYEYNEYTPFAFKWAVYDVADNRFYELSEEVFEKYNGLEQICLDNGACQPVGDADFDGVLTVLDATYIQRVIAKLDEYNMRDDITEFFALYGDLDYVSDMNRDGIRDILDATAIQRKLAKFENYIVTSTD